MPTWPSERWRLFQRGTDAARAQEGQDGRLGAEHVTRARAHQPLDEGAVRAGKRREGDGREHAHQDRGLLERRIEDVAEPLGGLLQGLEGRQLLVRSRLERVDGGAGDLLEPQVMCLRRTFYHAALPPSAATTSKAPPSARTR